MPIIDLPTRLSPGDSLLLEGLADILHGCLPMALAYSGGLDSRFLAHMALRSGAGDRVRLFHIQGPHVPAAESRQALARAKAMGLGCVLLSLDPLQTAQVRGNDERRCYHCKRYLFTALRKAASELPFFAGTRPVLCDGSNSSDAEQYRPGLRALQELAVRSPLAEAGLRKEDIHRLAALTGMEDPRQKARPCLLTRFAYGVHASRATLEALEAAEDAVAKLLAAAPAQSGAGPDRPDFRLRVVAGPHDGREKADALRVELHLSAKVPEALAETLEEAVVTNSAGRLPAPRLVVLDTLSGHYDRKRALLPSEAH